jgi:hypothetical protein
MSTLVGIMAGREVATGELLAWTSLSSQTDGMVGAVRAHRSGKDPAFASSMVRQPRFQRTRQIMASLIALPAQAKKAGGDDILPNVGVHTPNEGDQSLRYTDAEWDETYGAVLLREFKDLAGAQKASSDSLTARSGQLFALCAGFYAVAQTAALSTFGQPTGGSHESTHAVLGWAIGASVFLALTGALVIFATVLRKFKAIGPADIVDAANRAAHEDEDLAIVLVDKYRVQINNADKVLMYRRRWLAAAMTFAVCTLAVTSVEIIVALSARL